MRRVLITCIFLCSIVTFSCQSDNHITEPAIVYICTGPRSVCYHKYSTCRGLSRCSTEILSVSIQEATNEKNHRRECHVCY